MPDYIRGPPVSTVFSTPRRANHLPPSVVMNPMPETDQALHDGRNGTFTQASP